MVLEIRFHSTLKHYVPQGSAGVMMVHIPESITAKELLSGLNVNLQEVQNIMVNGLRREFDHTLSDGDLVGVFPRDEV